MIEREIILASPVHWVKMINEATKEALDEFVMDEEASLDTSESVFDFSFSFMSITEREVYEIDFLPQIFYNLNSAVQVNIEIKSREECLL